MRNTLLAAIPNTRIGGAGLAAQIAVRLAARRFTLGDGSTWIVMHIGVAASHHHLSKARELPASGIDSLAIRILLSWDDSLWPKCLPGDG